MKKPGQAKVSEYQSGLRGFPPFPLSKIAFSILNRFLISFSVYHLEIFSSGSYVMEPRLAMMNLFRLYERGI